MKNNRKKRTTWDFSEYTHTFEIFKSHNNNDIRIDHLRKGNSNIGYVRFVNDDYGLSIYGDFGNWIFNRPFIPSKDGYVSEMYWLEKLRISSTQQPSKYSADETRKEIEELIKTGLEEYGHSGDKLNQLKEWYYELLNYVDDEIEYTYHAYRDYSSPENDNENIPFSKELSYQLQIIFDAFDEICNRLNDD